jgi:chromosomal replication initiation ATPase DnaA
MLDTLDAAAPKTASWTRRQIFHAIIDQVAADWGCTFDEVVGPDRTQRIRNGRWAAICVLIRTFPDLSYPQVARIFNRDHTSIMFAVQNTMGREPRQSVRSA